VFGPDENTSNKLDAIYEVSKKLWLADYKPEDADGGQLSTDGRVLEMLSEHTLEGWLEGYLLTGRHGFFSTYEAFVHVIDSMFNQHAKRLAICDELPWRAPLSSLNLLITSTEWREDHKGFTHQDPRFHDLDVNKDREFSCISASSTWWTSISSRHRANIHTVSQIGTSIAFSPWTSPSSSTSTATRG